jgi:WD40 repeat protein
MDDHMRNLLSWRLLLALSASALTAGTVGWLGCFLNFPCPRPILTLEESDQYYPSEFSRSGQLLLGTYRGWGYVSWSVWEVSTGRIIDRAGRPAGQPSAHNVTFGPTDQLALVFIDQEVFEREVDESGVGRIEGKLVLRDLNSSQDKSTLVGGLATWAALDFSPDGSLLATQDAKGRLAVWDVASGRQRPILSAGKSVREPDDIRFSLDGKTLGAAFPDGTVRLWDPISSLEQSQTRISEQRLPLYCVLSRDLRWMQTLPKSSPQRAADTDDKWKLWRLPAGEQVARVRTEGQTRVAQFLSNGQPIALEHVPHTKSFIDFLKPAEGPDFDLVLSEWETGEVVATLPRVAKDGFYGIVSPDGRTCAVKTYPGPIKLWDLPSRRPHECRVWAILAVAVAVSLLAGASAWWVTGRGRAKRENGFGAPVPSN